MKTILCYGDSNTWGYNPKTKKKYQDEIRWSSILQKELGENFKVITEGLNGRTTVWDDPIEGEFKNGKSYLLPCIHSHKPIDLVIFYLGANDLKYRFSVSAYDIAKSIETLVNITEESKTGTGEKAPKILIITPTIIGKLDEPEGAFFGAEEKSKRLPHEFNKVFKNSHRFLLDSNEIIKTSPIDGVHLHEESHRILGIEVSKIVKEIL